VALILGANMDTNVSIEIYMKYDKLLILKKKNDRGAYLKFVQNLKTIFLKLETQRLNSNKIKNLRTKFNFFQNII
jgi:hypothetical protein